MLWEDMGVLTNPFPDPLDRFVESIVRVSNAVPDDVEYGYHWCWGNAPSPELINDLGWEGEWKNNDEKANVPPWGRQADLGKHVELSNAVMSKLSRPPGWVHIPVPYTAGEDYFTPAKELKLDPRTEVYLGLVHWKGGAEGIQRRIELASSVFPRFGVATECGIGRWDAGKGITEENLAKLIDLHAEAAKPVR
jgi:methionine synthase II (cobalamin-independent)